MTIRAVVLFAGRVTVEDLEVLSGCIPMTLGGGAGLDLVCEVADLAGITITDLP